MEVWKSIHLKSFKERIERSEPPPPDERKQRIEDEDIYNEQLVEAIGRAIKLGKSLGDVLEDICDEFKLKIFRSQYLENFQKLPETRANNIQPKTSIKAF